MFNQVSSSHYSTYSQVMHTEGGLDMIKHFLTNISALKPDWTMDQVLEEQMRKINELVRENTPTFRN